MQPEFSPALELAWQAAADEALQLGSSLLEPCHLLIGICSLEKVLARPASDSRALASDRHMEAKSEHQAWTESLADVGMDSTALRRAVRQAAQTRSAKLATDARIHRSAASLEVFAKAAVIAEAASSKPIRLLHLGAALLEDPEAKIDAAFEVLNKRKVDLQIAVARRASQANRADSLRQDDSGIKIFASLDASISPFSVGTKIGMDEERAALLYELPLRFGRGGPLPEMLHETVSRIGKVICGASCASLLVKDRSTGNLLLLAHVPAGAPVVSMTLAQRVLDTREACIWMRTEGDLSASLNSQGVQSGLYAPLMWNGEALGVFSVSIRDSRVTPTKEDLKLVVALAHHAAMALANSRFQNDLQRKSELLERLLTNFSPRVRNTLLSKAEHGRLRLGGEKSEVTLLCSDIRGFTKLSETLPTDEIVELLNDYFAGLVDAIFQHDGTIDKFIGDGILAVFGSPEPDPAQHQKAILAALAMQKAMRERGEARRARGLVTCEVGIGLHCGEVLHGFIGSADRMEFTVIGDAVNRTARYCSGAGCAEILISPTLFQHVWQIADVEANTIATKHEGDFQAYKLKGLKA
jgi:adenylate cyclase